MSEQDSSRVCTKCGVDRPVADFRKNPKTGGPYTGNCKSCVSAYNKAYRTANAERLAANYKRWAQENRDIKRAISKRWREAHPDYYKRWTEENAEHKAEYDRLYRECNPDARKKEWQRIKADPERLERVRARTRVHNSKRKAWILGSGGAHTADDIEQLYEEQTGLCAYCACELKGVYEVDHMTPLSRGGSNGRENLALACVFCNRSKNSDTVEEFFGRPIRRKSSKK